MITEDSLAAATIAQIFGSELLRAQQNARTDGGHQPEIVKMHPTQFIQQTHSNRMPSPSRAQQDKMMLQMLQREAELSCPLPEPTYTPPPPPPAAQPVAVAQPVVASAQPAPVASQQVVNMDSNNAAALIDTLKTINGSMERIANSLEKMLKLDEEA
jgi:hypothetical protein